MCVGHWKKHSFSSSPCMWGHWKFQAFFSSRCMWTHWKDKLSLALSVKQKFNPFLVLGLPRHLVPQKSKIFIYGCVTAASPRRMVCRGDAAKKKRCHKPYTVVLFRKLRVSAFIWWVSQRPKTHCACFRAFLTIICLFSAQTRKNCTHTLAHGL